MDPKCPVKEANIHTYIHINWKETRVKDEGFKGSKSRGK